MSFEWQTKEHAAATLEVDAATLQAWIDQGRAPSRTTDGRVEVLIEFPDEAEATDADAEVVVNREPTPGINALEVVSRRELQMAGGIAAAWQRLAEQSDHELVRARRMSTTAWSLVAALVLLSGGGIWWATHATLTARADAGLTRQDLTHLTTASEERGKQIDQLTGRLAAAQQELSRAQADLAAATERAAAAARQLEQAAGQHGQTVAAMKETLDQQRQRLSDLQATLAQQRRQNDAVAKELERAKEQLADAATVSEDLKKQLATVQADDEPRSSPQ